MQTFFNSQEEFKESLPHLSDSCSPEYAGLQQPLPFVPHVMNPQTAFRPVLGFATTRPAASGAPAVQREPVELLEKHQKKLMNIPHRRLNRLPLLPKQQGRRDPSPDEMCSLPKKQIY